MFVYWKYFSRPRVSAVSANGGTCPAGGSVPAPPVPVTFGVEVPDDSQVLAVELYMSRRRLRSVPETNPMRPMPQPGPYPPKTRPDEHVSGIRPVNCAGASCQRPSGN